MKTTLSGLALTLGLALMASSFAEENAAQPPKAPDRVRRGMLGVQLGQEPEITALTPGGAAEKAGLKEGDRILRVDGKPIAGALDLQKILVASPDRPLVVTIKRKDQELDVHVTCTSQVTDSPELQQEYQDFRKHLQETLKGRGEEDGSAVLRTMFGNFALAHPRTDVGAGAWMQAFYTQAHTLAPEALIPQLESFVDILPPEHAFHGELEQFHLYYAKASTGTPDLKRWLAVLEKLGTTYPTFRGDLRLAAAHACQTAGDETAALGFADGIQKDFPGTAAAEGAGRVAYDLRVLGKGKPAPDFQVPTLDGKGELTLSALKGHPVLVDLWASWCGPCKAALPKVLVLHQEFSGKGLQVVSVTLDTPKGKEAAQKEVDALKLPWVQGWDSQAFAGPVAKAYNVQAIPTYILVDAQGLLVGKWVGFDEEAIRKALQTLLPKE